MSCWHHIAEEIIIILKLLKQPSILSVSPIYNFVKVGSAIHVCHRISKDLFRQKSLSIFNLQLPSGSSQLLSNQIAADKCGM